jgi:CelD/BcsL family acetyltransferase involved in cellulose biosynthesis
MALDIPFLGEPLARGRPVVRKAALALEPVAALSRLAERIHALSERALQPNPFLLPAFLGPAIEAMGPSSLRLATLTDRNDIRFFAPVLVRATRLTVWTSPYFPLGAPLIEAETCEQVVEALLEQMRVNGRRLLIMPNMPLLGPAAECIRSVAERTGSTLTAERQARPILRGGGGVAAFDEMVPAKRRRDLERQLRKLGEAGGVSHVTATSPSEVDAAFGSFLALEAAGWKGRRGTAMQRRRATRRFATEAVAGLARKGAVRIDTLRVGEKPAAVLIRFEQSGLAIPWKIAYDESLSTLSPGKQLMADATRRWLADGVTTRVDPVCEEDNPTVGLLWRHREPYGTLMVAIARWSFEAHLRASLLDLRMKAKRRVKDFLARRHRKPSPKAAKAS